MSSKNKQIKYGDIELDETEFASQSVKVRITTMIDEDVLNSLKKISKSKGIKYQTLLNQILRKHLLGNKVAPNNTEKRIRQIVREELKLRKRA